MNRAILKEIEDFTLRHSEKPVGQLEVMQSRHGGAEMPSKGKRSAKETVAAVAKTAAKEAKAFADEVADAAAAAAAPAKVAASVVLDKVATAIEARGR